MHVDATTALSRHSSPCTSDTIEIGYRQEKRMPASGSTRSSHGPSATASDTTSAQTVSSSQCRKGESQGAKQVTALAGHCNGVNSLHLVSDEKCGQSSGSHQGSSHTCFLHACGGKLSGRPGDPANPKATESRITSCITSLSFSCGPTPSGAAGQGRKGRSSGIKPPNSVSGGTSACETQPVAVETMNEATCSVRSLAASEDAEGAQTACANFFCLFSQDVASP